MEKKGILARNSVSLILAAIGIVVVVIVVAKIYSSVMINDEAKSAGIIIDSLVSKIDRVEKSGIVTIQGVPSLDSKTSGSSGDVDSVWFLVGWSKGEEDRPNRCFFSKSCLCLCRVEKINSGFLNWLDNTFWSSDGGVVEKSEFTASCQSRKTGVCRNLDESTLNVGSLYYQTPSSYTAYVASQARSNFVTNAVVGGIHVITNTAVDTIAVPFIAGWNFIADDSVGYYEVSEEFFEHYDAPNGLFNLGNRDFIPMPPQLNEIIVIKSSDNKRLVLQTRHELDSLPKPNEPAHSATETTK